MALLIFPSSPLPGGLHREKLWGGNNVRYDSGAAQGFTAFKKPLYRWSVPWKNINEIKQLIISSFADNVRGNVDPFLMKDPYDYLIGSVQLVNTNQTQGGTLQTFDTRSFSVRIDSTFIGSLTSNLSGYVTLGTEYDYDQDNGILTVNTIAATDFWTIPATVEYFRKVKFEKDYSDTSPLWNQFSVQMVIFEIT